MARKLRTKLPASRRPPKSAAGQAKRGRDLGRKAAEDVINRRGCTLARHNADQLMRQARLPRADSFDKAYARAYAEAADRCHR
jgi:hypothetical protein